MSENLKELLFTMRQHAAFPEFMEHVGQMMPPVLEYKPSRDESQQAEWIYRSGRRAQHNLLQSFLTGYDDNSQQEKS